MDKRLAEYAALSTQSRAASMEARRNRTKGELPPPPLSFHASLVSQEGAFCPLTHFGTLRAAMERASNVAHKRGWQYHPDLGSGHPDIPIMIYPVSLYISKPMRVLDEKDGRHSPTELADMLYYTMRKKISSEERDRILSAEHHGSHGASTFADVLRARGYNGLVYANACEDAGADTWVIFDGTQSVSAGPPVSTTLGEMVKTYWKLWPKPAAPVVKVSFAKAAPAP